MGGIQKKARFLHQNVVEGQLLLPPAQKTRGALSLTFVNNLQETLASAAIGLHALQAGKTA